VGKYKLINHVIDRGKEGKNKKGVIIGREEIKKRKEKEGLSKN